MNTLFVPQEQTVTLVETRCEDNIYEESDKVQNEIVSYEHEGYQVRVHFNGNKTLRQCIWNLAKRRIEG
ncbi:MAG: hypothetical protein SOY12_03185 [Schaedlerella sp.]|nr:hypothetical protein [Schaedlerella sp.]